MEWWQAILLGIVQGLTEFLPVSSSGHLMIFKELFGVDGDGFLDFTVTVHSATVLSTIVVFRKPIWRLLKGFFLFKINEETDYILKIIVSMIPVALVGLFFRESVESLFKDNLSTVAVFLIVTAVLLFVSDNFSYIGKFLKLGILEKEVECRNGISYLQALIVGLGQALAVAPGLSRSGTTIAAGIISGVKREVIAQFSFLMVLVPIIGEQFLGLVSALSGDVSSSAAGLGALPLLLGFAAAFLSGLFACKVMIAIVKKAKLTWFALYCVLVSVLIFLLT